MTRATTWIVSAIVTAMIAVSCSHSDPGSNHAGVVPVDLDPATDGPPEDMTKWGPKLSADERTRIAQLTPSQWFVMLAEGDALHAYAALGHLTSPDNLPMHYEALLALAAQTSGDMIVEGFATPVAADGPEDCKRIVDALLDLLEAQLEADKPTVSGPQAIRSAGQAVYPRASRTPRQPARDPPDPPYAHQRVRTLLLANLKHEDWRVRKQSIYWLVNTFDNDLSTIDDVVSAIESQSDYEASIADVEGPFPAERRVHQTQKQLQRLQHRVQRMRSPDGPAPRARSRPAADAAHAPPGLRLP